MKLKHKGKIYPSPASASLPAPPCNRDVLSVMRLLPAAILALASVLSLEDQEVLAYMITRSLDSSTLSSSNLESSKGSRRRSKKLAAGAGGGGAHRPPVFGCDCFDCYTSYWDRWNTSPNGELIHQAIEAFEEHLTTGEASSKRTGRGKRKEKPGRRVAAQPEPEPEPELKPDPPHDQLGEPVYGAHFVVAAAAVQEQARAVVSTENEAMPVTSPVVEEAAEEEEALEEEEEVGGCGGTPEAAAAGGGSPHKGLARKVLPDVLGLLNSRLWNLWSPNV